MGYRKLSSGKEMLLVEIPTKNPYNVLMSDSSFEHTYAALPPELKKEVKDFAEFLLAKRSVTTKSDSAIQHPLAHLAGVWRHETITDEDLLSKRTMGRELDL